MELKIYLTIMISSSLFAFPFLVVGLSASTIFVNVLAQEGAITPEGSVNDTLSGQNASQWATNATLAFAQEGMLGGDAGMIDGTINTTGGRADGKSGENGTINNGQ
jgi:hypothetical protein